MGLALSGCGLLQDQLSPGRTTIRGVPPDIELLSDPATSAAAETRLLTGLQERAGLGARQPSTPEDWHLILLAGVRVIDGQCDQYLDALFRFNREQRAGRQGLAAAAGASGAILGLSGVGATAIAITAAAFGLGSSLFDASVSSVLFTIEPSALRNVVLEGRRNYLKDIATRRIDSRPATMIALQGYLTQCSPAAIEANINNAANGSRNAVTSPNRDEARDAAVAAAPGVLLSREQRAQDTITRPVRPGPVPAPVATVPAGLSPNEAGITRADIETAQRALGVAVTGQIGPRGSPTRLAIAEFESGMKARNAPEWGEPTAELAGRVADTLTTLRTPMPGDLQSPFERAFLTNDARTPSGASRHSAVDNGRVALVWRALFPGEAPPPAIGDRWARLRPAIAAKRSELGLNPGKTFVDAALWERIRPPD